MYNIDSVQKPINTPIAAVALPGEVLPDEQAGDKPGGQPSKNAQATPQSQAVNPFEMPALSPEFSKEILAKLELLKGAAPMNIIDSALTTGPKLDVPIIPGSNPENAGQNNMMVSEKLPPQIRSVASLTPGQTFSAEILDVKQGTISLRLSEGGVLNARSLVTPDARIGDMASFVVREAKPGQISLEFLKGEGKVPASIVREALSAANMQPTTANAAIIEDLVTRNMPIDTSTIQRAAFFKYSMPNAPFEQVQFLLENNFAPTERTVQIFQNVMHGDMTLQTEIEKAVSQMEKSIAQPSSQSAMQASQATAQHAELTGLLNKLKEHQTMPPPSPGAPPQDPNTFLEGLKSIAQEIATAATASGNTALAQTAENIADIIDFSKNVTDNKAYFQLPFHGENPQLAELHVFKKKGGTSKKNDGRIATAMIALDMAHLGRVEILVNKNDKNINLQFRSDKDKTINTVTLNSLDLSNLLKDAGFVLAGLKAKKISEKFDITQSEPETKKQKAAAVPNIYEDVPKRYSLDVRV